jgi:hypothetical protein
MTGMRVAVLALGIFALAGWDGGNSGGLSTHAQGSSRTRSATDGLIEFRTAAGGQPGTVIFKDDFHHPRSGWPRHSQGNFVVGYKTGAYFIRLTRTGSQEAVAAPSPAAGNVLINVLAIIAVTGRSDTRFGLVCRVQTAPNRFGVVGYEFLVYSDGTFGIGRTGKNTATWLAGGASSRSSLIPPGSDKYQIGASCSGDVLTLFVDGVKIASAKDNTYATGQYGLIAGLDSNGSAPAEVRFTDFVVRRSTAAR